VRVFQYLSKSTFVFRGIKRYMTTPDSPKDSIKGFKRRTLNLRAKATLLAIAIGTLPVIATGTLAYFATSPSVQKEAISKQESRASEASNLASRFMFERYGDIQILSNLPIFANPKVSTIVTNTQKQAILDKYIKIYGVYDSIALLDLDGNATVYSTGKQLPNYKDRLYFQTVLKTQKPFISQPETSKVTGSLSIFFAAPVFDVETGKMIAIVRSRMPVKYLAEVVRGVQDRQSPATTSQELYVADSAGRYFIAGEGDEDEIGIKAEEDLSVFPRLRQSKKFATEVYWQPAKKVEELLTYTPGTRLKGLPDLDWSILVVNNAKTAFSALDNLRLALIAGTAVAAILVSAAAVFLANRATRPIIDSAEAVKKIGRGELDTRVSVSGQDELADLGTNINQMAEQLQSFLNQQQDEARERQLLTEISQARAPQALELPLNTLLAEVRETMQLDRAVVYRFYPDWSGHIVAESVLPGWPVALADKIEDACIPHALLDAYKKGRVVPTRDVFDAGFHPDHLELMKRLQIKANLVVPIRQGNELFGILVAHHCAKTHDWQQSEIESLQKAASKMGAPMGSLALFERQEYKAEQERNRSQGLQMELMNLLNDVQGASDGDLTVRADVSAGEIGIVADFFNSIVESLRGIVSQVKDASAQVNTSIGSNEAVMGKLADEAQTQSLQITDTLKSVEQMALSIQQVAQNAQQVAEVSQMASLSAAMGGKTMDRTVESIVELRETVTETAQQVKRLGESSKKISKAVTLINQISLQTNVLAVNASIEAARAGEEGQGFAVVAEEVAALAAQSAAATKEIEQIVRTIQSETSSVVKAMARGTTQVDKGTRQVEEAKESLQQIVQVSQQIDELLQSISSATVSQTETSEVVKLLMGQINQSSERTSDTSRQVSTALKETVAIAQQLQASVGTFKIEADKN
jgi:methyl-accepting chemotaxis protein PixJ